MSLSGITHAERAGWQRLAAAELAAILHAYRVLPVISWTVGPAGASLVGQVNGLQPAVKVRATFEVWRVALALAEQRELTGCGASTHLSAAGYRNRVRVGINATVLDDEREG